MSDTAPEATFRSYLAEGRFMVQRSASTGETVFPPRVMVPGNGLQDLEWVPATGLATIHSFTVVSQKPPREDYNICLVDLQEGPRVLSRVVGLANEELAIGLAVEAVVDGRGDDPVLLFRPRADGGQ